MIFSIARCSLFMSTAMAAAMLFAGDNVPWTKEKAWRWYNDQPWIRGCNYMPASAANRMDMWQEYGSGERFEEMDRELKIASDIGFNTVRVALEENGFGAWYYEHDHFMKNFEKFLQLCDKYGIRAIVVLGNDCSRPKALWSIPKPGPQPCDWGYHGGRKLSQHGSFVGQIGYISADDPELKPKFFRMCEEVMEKYRTDRRILFWNIWNEPGNNGRTKVAIPLVREMFALARKIGVEQPCAADVWNDRYDTGEECAEKVAAELSDIISFHCYGPMDGQRVLARKLKERFGRPVLNTEWLARIRGCDVQDCYPYFAQERIGNTCWGFVAGKYQTYEPWEGMWRAVEQGRGRNFMMSKWFHDLLRPSLRPYDPEEIKIIKRVNAQMDAEKTGGSLRARIAAARGITGEDMWYGYRRTSLDFDGRKAWVVEPSIEPRTGNPWTWCVGDGEAFVERTAVPELLKEGYHHVWIDLAGCEDRSATMVRFRRFLVDELGFAPKAGLIGLGAGGEAAVRYAASSPEMADKIYLDNPVLNGAVRDAGRIAAAKIPVMLVYGEADAQAVPAKNAIPFAAALKAAGAAAQTVVRAGWGHFPYGFDVGETKRIVTFFIPEIR